MNSVDYFETPNLIGLRQQVKHLSQFGADALVIEGPSGSGKSVFCSYLCANIEADSERDLPVYITSLELDHSVSLQELLQNIAHSLNIDAEGQSAGSLLTQLRSYSQHLIREKKLSLLFLDGADRLEDDALGALVSLVQAEGERAFGFKLLMFAGFGLAERIDQLGLLELVVYDFQMPPFSTDELRRFLDAKVEDFEERCGAELPNLAAIWNQAQGYPGIALAIIDEAESSASEKALSFSSDWAKFPVLHIGIAVLLLSVLLLSFFYRSGDEKVVERKVVRPPLSQSEKVAKASGIEGRESGSVSEIYSAEELPDPSQEEFSESTPMGDGEAIASSEGADDSLDVDSAAAVTREPVGGFEEEEYQEVADEEHASESETFVKMPPAPVSAPADLLTKDELFLLAANDDAYVLQLLAASKRPALDRFVTAQSNRSVVRIYRRPRSADGPWYIVVIGPYSSKSEAMLARENLPAEQKKAGPWPKSLVSVKSEIEAFRRN